MNIGTCDVKFCEKEPHNKTCAQCGKHLVSFVDGFIAEKVSDIVFCPYYEEQKVQDESHVYKCVACTKHSGVKLSNNFDEEKLEEASIINNDRSIVYRNNIYKIKEKWEHLRSKLTVNSRAGDASCSHTLQCSRDK